jgi:hypothetical protein
MATKRRKVEATTESLGVVPIFYLFFNAFVGAFWRLFKTAYSKQRPVWSNVIVDCLAIGFIILVMTFCHYYRGIIYIGSYLVFTGMIGFLRHQDYKTEGFIEWMDRNHPEDLKLLRTGRINHRADEDNYVAPKVNFAPKPQNMKATNGTILMDNDTKLNEWLSKNPELKVEE